MAVLPTLAATLAPVVARAANPMAVVDAAGVAVVANDAWESLPDAAALLAQPAPPGTSREPIPGLPGYELISVDRRELPRPPAPGEAELRRVIDTLATFVGLATPEGMMVDIN